MQKGWLPGPSQADSPHVRGGNETAVLQVDKLTKKFGGLTAVADFSFTLGHRELLGLIGPNGAGKTTVFNLLSGVLRPTSGKVTLQGEDITGLPPHKLTTKGIIRTFQNLKLMKGLSLLDNMRPAFHLRGSSGFRDSFFQNARYALTEKIMVEKIMDTLDSIGIGQYRNVNVEDLSYGIQKRAELARALLFEPKVLFLDEPAAGLNPQETDEVMNIVRHIHKTTETSIIVVEHNMKFVMGLSQRVIVMNQGAIIAEGPPAAVQSQPDVIKAYLGERAWKKQAQALEKNNGHAPKKPQEGSGC